MTYTNVYGNNDLLFHSGEFWFCIIFTVIFCLMPRYVAKSYKFQFHPDDINVSPNISLKEGFN